MLTSEMIGTRRWRPRGLLRGIFLDFPRCCYCVATTDMIENWHRRGDVAPYQCRWGLDKLTAAVCDQGSSACGIMDAAETPPSQQERD
jgi:hypothetical protein